MRILGALTNYKPSSVEFSGRDKTETSAIPLLYCSRAFASTTASGGEREREREGAATNSRPGFPTSFFASERNGSS